jgi:hypothetical protein
MGQPKPVPEAKAPEIRDSEAKAPEISMDPEAIPETN